MNQIMYQSELSDSVTPLCWNLFQLINHEIHFPLVRTARLMKNTRNIELHLFWYFLSHSANMQKCLLPNQMHVQFVSYLT
jgi:hypothetical protein